MVFSSSVFLFIFFPISYALYLILPNIKLKNIFLVIASLIFYAFGEPITVFLMLFSVIVNYLLGISIAKSKTKGKIYLISAVVFNLTILCIFKYLAFFIGLINDILPEAMCLPIPNIRLPIGISFFTFQILSYVIDVYKDKKLVQKNLLNVMLYISLFPQLIAGPIVKYYDVAMQIEQRDTTVENTALGLRRFIIGLSKKPLIANAMGRIADNMFMLQDLEQSTLTCWLGGITYTLQIYYDFSGYSDMAIGLGKMLGFSFRENFNYPYIAETMQDFWRRWHISLSTWFKEYLYIPLGGNRKGKLRTAFNKIIVFFFTGLWHGANITFVIWGLVHGLFLMLESYNIIPLKKIKFKPIKHLYTMTVVISTFVIFRSDNFVFAWNYIKHMFINFHISSLSLSIFCEQFDAYSMFMLVIAVVFSLPIIPKVQNKLSNKKVSAAIEYVSYGFSLAMVFLCIISLASASYNPFIYLQF